MVNINLIGKKRREASGRNWVVLSLTGLFVAFVVYFLGATIYVVAKLNLTKNAQAKIDEETVQISREMTANNELLRSFILSKFILGNVQSLSESKFPYKEYLDQLVTMMPEGVVLKNVDFATKGWISVAAAIPGISPLRTLEANLSEASLVAASPFSSIFAEGVSKERSGQYNAKLQFEIKKNGGN